MHKIYFQSKQSCKNNKDITQQFLLQRLVTHHTILVIDGIHIIFIIYCLTLLTLLLLFIKSSVVMSGADTVQNFQSALLEMLAVQ